VLVVRRGGGTLRWRRFGRIEEGWERRGGKRI